MPSLSETMTVARIDEDYGIGVTKMPIPAIPPRGALVKVVGCGVCGSDLDKFVHKKSSPGSILGHEMVGIVEALDEGHPGDWKVGDRLVSSHHAPCGRCHYCVNDSESMCRQFKRTNFNPGGFSQYVALSPEHLAHTAFQIPSDISWEEASCIEPLSCVLRAIRRGGTQVNGSVLIVGLGFIGMMAAQVYQNDGYAVYGVDLDPNRIHLAQSRHFVLDAFHPVEERVRLQETLNRHTTLGKVDTVFLTAVNPKTLALALDYVRDGGNLIIFTSAPEGTQVDPSRLYFREINLITSYSPALSDLREAAQMIFQQKIEVEPLISHRLPLQDVQQAFELYRSGQALKVFLQMGESQ